MRKRLSFAFIVACIAALNLGFCALLFAGSTSLATLMSAPYAYYKSIAAKYTFTGGSSGTPLTRLDFNGGTGNSDPAAIEVRHNGSETYQSGTSGGNLTITGNVSFLDHSTLASSLNPMTLCYIDASNARVGIGTSVPRTTLEVRPNSGFGNGTAAATVNLNLTPQQGGPLNLGDVKGMIVTAHQSGAVRDYTYPWTEMNAQFNAADSFDTAQNDGARAGFAAVSSSNVAGGGYYWVTTHIDGDPLCFQTTDKTAQGVTTASGYGQVVIRGYPTTVAQITSGGTYQNRQPADWATNSNHTGDKAILVVGEWDTTVYGAVKPEARAYVWNTVSSREFKKDIMPFQAADYGRIASTLSAMDVNHYHYKGEKPEAPLRSGFIAEDAPAELVPHGRNMVGLQDTVGFLLASLKAIKIENDDMDQRLRRLES